MKCCWGSDNMKKKHIIPAVTGICLAILTACSAPAYKDGTYKAYSSEDEEGAYGEITITITDGKISDCTYLTWQADGSVKDENYGKVYKGVESEEYYKTAQAAVAASKQYAADLKDFGDLELVDGISGATRSYNQFTEAATLALEQAQG